MLKMILADDEPVITRGIRKLVDWDRLGISIIGECDNGSSAMEQILVMNPDIALLDISMPGMDGIEILKSIKELGLSTKVVLISGFQDFEYARSAITYGAVEYLLKPVIREELLGAVEKAAGQLLGRIREEHTDWESGQDVLWETADENSEDTNAMEETTYLPVLAEVLFDGNEGAQEQKLVHFSFVSFLEEYLSEKNLGILFTKQDHIILVLKGIRQEQTKEILSEIWQEACEMTGKKTAFAAGELVDRMSRIPEEYEKCLELSRFFFFEDQIRIPVLTVGEPVFYQKAGMEELTEARERVIDALISQDGEQFGNAFEYFAKMLCLNADGRKEDACYYFCSAIRLAEDRMHSMNLDGGRTDMKELLERGRMCCSFREMKSIFRKNMEMYLILMKNIMESNDKKDIVKAKEYIEKHYRENLTLEILAGEIHMNPYYFSSYFKKNAGENFKDYVSRVRIQHAVSLLITSDMKVYEIAAEVGFRDVRSFTDVFSRMYGETPNSYRKRVLERG